MKKSVTLVFLLFSFALIFAQPANDNCNTATAVIPNGTCYGGTTVAAADSWQGSVGCQGGGSHPDVWYTFTSSGSQAQFTITASAPWSGNVEVILVEGTCAGGFTIVGSQCGPSPLNATFIGLSNGTVYYYTISNANGGTPGPFQTCLTTTTPPTLAGQNCNNAAILCNSNAFSQSTSNAGFGLQEVSAANSCWGVGGERQSKWFKFTAGCSGTLEFNINPVNGNDDYDWALWNITSDPNGCTTKGNSIACNWSGCTGSTGISTCPTNEPGFKSCGSSTGGDPCGNGNFPRAWGNWSAPGGGASSCLTSTMNLVAGNVYALLIDNFSISNSGFSLVFGGACGGGTATLGPNANFTYTSSGCGTYNFIKTCPTSNSTFLWQFGDGTTATTQNASHTYSTFGNFVITLQVTDALGCVTTYSQTINIVSTPLPTVTTPVTYCVGAIASPLTASGSNLLWYTTSTGGVGSSTAPTPSISTAGTTSYYVSQTIGGCESARVQIDVIVNANVIPTFNAVTPICSGGTLSALPTTSLNGITGTWSPAALNNTATTTYTFTPTAGQCATTTSLTITVNSNVIPTFNAVAPICSGSTLSALPTTSLNGITGTWSPALNNAATITYTFTPTVGQCATTALLTITVNSNVTPTFNAVAPICSGGTLTALPTTSLNGITGTWLPALNNAATTTYTFTPTVGQCATTALLVITVNSNVTPTFNAIAPICSGGTLSALPTTSLNGITGTWLPALNNAATTTYTFTPTVGQCATTALLTITVNSNVTPTFNAVAPICSGGTLTALPTTSLNGITGTWLPALNNAATTTYTFTPTVGQCATTALLVITVNSNVTPSFNAVAPICSGGTLSALPTTSLNGITGTWSPALNNTATTTYSFTPTAGQCATTASLTITVNSNVTPTFNAIAPICSGGTLSALPTTSLNGITGSWSPGLNNTATTTYTFTPSAGQCATTASLMITVNQILSPTINCGVSTTSSVTFTWSSTVTGATGYNISYQINTGSPVNIGAIGNVLLYQVSGLSGGDNVTINVTPTGGTCFVASSLSCTAISCLPPTANINYASPFCSNNTIAQQVSLTGTGAYTVGVYSALPDLTLNSTTGAIIPFSSVPGTYTVTYTVAASGGCPGTVATTSVTIYSIIPSVSIVSNTTSICAGGSVTFTATPTNGGTTPTYQWKINGVNVTGQTASTFTTTTINNGDIVTVTMSSSDPCANPVTATSNPITVTATLVIPSVSIVSSTTSICTGGSVTFTATPINGGTTPTYQWKVNGVNVTGQTASTFTTTTLNNGDVITVTMSSSDPCASPVTATSNPVTVTATLVIPSVSIVSSTTSICTGGSVTFTATPINGGTTPTYQWKVNGVNVTGQTASTFTTTTLNNGDVITVTMSSNDPCASPVTAASNPVTVTATLVIPSVSITSSTTSICAGGSITFTATPTNGGTNPTYQWKVNGVSVTGQTALTFTTTTLNNGDVVTVAMSSSDPCASPVTASSNSITITATPVTPLVSIASSTTSTCAGESVTFTATPINGGTTPTYQWKINGVNVTGQTASTFTTTTLNNGEVVTVMMSSSDPCANPINAASNTVVVTVNLAPTLIITNPQIFCAPFTVDLTALAIISGSSTGATYSWWLDAANTIPLSNPNTVAASGTYYIKSQSAAGCFTTKPVTVTIENKIPGIRYSDVTIVLNTPVTLQARRLQQNSTYKWSPNRGLNNYNNQDVVFSFDQKTEYLIAITSPAGCVTIDTQLVSIEITQSGIFVPKAWTPNGDGHNELLFPLTLNIVKINYFRIFNRWGQLMFETNTFNTGWNGIYKGKPQPIEVFTWSVEAVTIKGEIIKRSGNSVLIR